MKKHSSFKVGDKVFAKIRGYPAWPAEIIGKNGKKFKVKFYGTVELGIIAGEDLYYYLKNKDHLAKGSKKQDFLDAITQIEEAIAAEGGVDGSETNEKESSKRKRTNSDDSNVSENSASKKRSKTNSLLSTTEPRLEIPETQNERVNSTPSLKSDEEDNCEGNEEIEEDEEENDLKDNTTDDDNENNNNNIVSEQHLKHWIEYFKYVEKSPQIYKEMEPEKRCYAPDQSFPLKLPSGAYVFLRVHQSWPLEFASEYVNAKYDHETASRLLELKTHVEHDRVTAETDSAAFIEHQQQHHTLSGQAIRKEFAMQSIRRKYERVERLRCEAKIIEIEYEIKETLRAKGADTERCIALLDELAAKSVDEILLKKHAHLVDFLRKLCLYSGDVEQWDLAEAEAVRFTEAAQKIREKAERIFTVWKKSITSISSDLTGGFIGSFNALVRKFRDDCKHLSGREVFMLRAEPWRRSSIIDQLEQKAGLDIMIDELIEKEDLCDSDS